MPRPRASRSSVPRVTRPFVLRQAPGERSRGGLGAAAAIAAAGLLAAALATFTGRDRDLSIREYRTETASRTPVLEIRRLDSPGGGPVALLVHGFQCNKGMMAPLAKALARNGVDAYAIDLPGHGASADRFSPARAKAVVREAVEHVLAARGIGPERLALVGHSYGALVLAPIAASDPRLRANVFLGPVFDESTDAAALRNVLVITADRDDAFVLDAAAKLLREATGGVVQRAGLEIGTVADGTARAWRTAPGGHVSLVYGPEAARETVAWIAAALGPAPRGEPAQAWGMDGVAASAGLLAIALALVLALLLARAWPAVPSRPAPLPARPGPLAPIALVALGAGLLAAGWIHPLRALRLHEGGAIASLLLVTGVVGLALAGGARRRTLPSLAEVTRGLPPAILGACLVLATASFVSGHSWYGLSFPGAAHRLGPALLLAAAVLPFFAWVDAALAELRSGGGTRGLALAALAAIGFHALVATSLALVGHRLERFALPVFVLGAGAAAFGAAAGAIGRNRAIGFLFSSVVAGWVLAVGFLRF